MSVDIHNHTLFGVDDGPNIIEDSVKMLHSASEQGVSIIILTPHYRHGMFSYPIEDIEKNFETLQSYAKEVGIKLYLGCEYHVDGDMIERLRSGRCKSLGGSDYVLSEYSHNTESKTVKDSIQQLLSNGYIPVVAHAERYECFTKLSFVEEIQAMGAVIQCNADSVLGIDGRILEKRCKKLLKHGLVDIIASDAHGIEERANHMAQCRQLVEKKYGEDYGKRLFEEAAYKIVADIEFGQN